jgi:tetratricopeptide (TPR) repeat protein
MFRPRRPFRRRPPLRRPFAPGARPSMPPAVAEAERLMRAGQFDKAADRFDRLAREAEKRARPGAAGELYLRAARCYVELDNLDRADECAEQAIHFFIQAQRPDRVRQVLPRVLAALERHGRRDDAERLRREVEEVFQGMDLLPGPAKARMAARLPAKCPNCAGPIRPDEVAWAGPATAECPYCGGVVKAE